MTIAKRAFHGASDDPLGPRLAAEEPPARFRRWSTAISWIAMIAPILIVAASTLGSALSVRPQGTIRVRTVLAMMLAGLSLREWHTGEARRLGGWLAGVITAGGVLSLVAQVRAVDDASREALYRSSTSGSLVSPGWLSLPSSIIVSLMGASLWSLHRRWPARWTEGLALSGCALSMVAAIGHLYHADELFAPLSPRGIEMTPSLILALICFGVLIACPHEGAMAIVATDRPAGRIARGLLPPIVLVPIIFGSLSLTGARSGLYDPQLGMALVVVATIAVLGSLVLMNAAVLLRVDQRLEAVQAKLVEMHRIDAARYLAGWLCHELNNLLTVIRGNSELILQEPVSATVREYVAEVDSAAHECSGLTRKLLRFSSHDVAPPQRVELSVLIAEMRPTLEAIVGPSVRVTLALEPGCAARANRHLLVHALTQLILNARDAMPEGGELVVSTVHRAEIRYPVCLTVADTGVGMSADVRARAIEPFFTTKPRGRGTGLGLATVFGILNQHDARMDIESAPGRGTTVSIFFPACSQPAVRDAALRT
jgi:signal transduction histidine kinase